MTTHDRDLKRAYTKPLVHATRQIARRIYVRSLPDAEVVETEAAPPIEKRAERREFGALFLKPNGRAVGRFRLGHRQHSKVFNTAAQAERWLDQQRALLDIGAFTPPAAKRTTIDRLFQLVRDDYKVQGRRSLRRLESALTHLVAAFGGMRALNVDTARVRHYERERLDAGASRSTVNKELAVLRRAFILGEDLVPKRPRISTPDPHNRRTGFLDAEDFSALLAALPAAVQPPVQFAYLTGWRMWSEVLSLTWDRVDLVAQTVRLDTSKSGEPRLFPFKMLPALVTLLKTQRERTTALERRTGTICRWVFHRNGRPIRDFMTAWRSGCDRAAHEERNGLRVVVRPQLLGRVPHDQPV